MASRLEDRGLVVATDLRGRRVDLLARTVRTTMAHPVAIVRADATQPLPFGNSFDAVLLDAPCSGLGTVRRDPDIRWRRSAADLEGFATAQLTMLERVASVIKPGGRLIYATCSSEPEENGFVVERFLDRQSGFARAERETIVPLLAPFLDAHGDFETRPYRDGLEAFYAAMLVKTKDLR